MLIIQLTISAVNTRERIQFMTWSEFRLQLAHTLLISLLDYQGNIYVIRITQTYYNLFVLSYDLIYKKYIDKEINVLGYLSAYTSSNHLMV